MNFWDILAWISFGIVFLYFLLKIFGVLKSPIIADTIALISAAYFVGKYAQKIDHNAQKIDYNTQKLDQTTQKIDEIAKDVEVLRRECPIIKKK